MKPTTEPWKTVVLWMGLSILSLAPAVAHYLLVDHRLGSVRYPWGLIPAPFVALRALATFSIWLSIGILAAFVWSFRRPIAAQRLLFGSTVAVILYFIAYTSYALFIVAVLLAKLGAHGPSVASMPLLQAMIFTSSSQTKNDVSRPSLHRDRREDLAP